MDWNYAHVYGLPMHIFLHFVKSWHEDWSKLFHRFLFFESLLAKIRKSVYPLIYRHQHCNSLILLPLWGTEHNFKHLWWIWFACWRGLHFPTNSRCPISMINYNVFMQRNAKLNGAPMHKHVGMCESVNSYDCLHEIPQLCAIVCVGVHLSHRPRRQDVSLS